MKRKFLSLLTILFALITSLAIFAACTNKHEDPAQESGEEVGVYYCDVDSAEWTITLSEACEFTLKLGSDERTGSYQLEGTVLKLVFSNKEDGELTATLQDDVITLSYNNSVYRFLKKITYTVTFNSNGGTAIEPVSVLNGKTVAQPTTDPVKDGYVFIGWYTDNDTFRNEYIFSQPVRGNLTLYARFVKPIDPEFEVTLDLNYDGAPAAETLTTLGGKVFDLPQPERKGYEFAGWWVSHFESADKLTYRYDEQELFAHTTFYAVWKESGMPLVSVSATGVSWTADGLNNSYKVKITPPSGAPVEATVSSASYAYDFASQSAGTYVVEVTLGNKTATAYYINKGLARVSVFAVEGSVLLWNSVPNAEGYEISYVCGTPGHDHVTTPAVATEARYNFQSCDMIPGGLVFSVRAFANDYVPAFPVQYTFERTLDAVEGLTVDPATHIATWNAVSNATSYDFVVTLNGTEVDSGNVVSTRSLELKTYDAGTIAVSVTPKAHGWNSPAATKYSYNKTAIATPFDIQLVGYRIEWNKVTGAVRYEITINGDTKEVNTNYYDLDANLNVTTLTIYVRALATDHANDSPLSDAYIVRGGTMSELSYANGRVSWDAVFGASAYFVSVNDGTPERTTATSYAVVLTQEGENVITVYALTADGETEAVNCTVIAYAVEFNVGTGHDTTPVDTIYLANGDPVPTLAEPTRLGYTFAGWYVDDECKNAYTDTTFLGSSTLTLFAKWAPLSFTITLVGDPSYSSFTDTTYTAYYEQPYELPVPKADQNDEMAFLGWYDQRNAGGNRYTDYTGVGTNVYNDLRSITLYAAFGAIFTWEHINGDNAGYRVSKNLPNISYVSEITIPATHLGERVTEITDFSSLSNLEVVHIPSSIKYIDLAANSAAFRSCSSLRAVEMYEASEDEVGRYESKYSTYQGVLYEITGAENVKLAFVPVAYEGVVTVKDGTQIIPANAFASTKGITEVVFPSSVTHIEEKAFYLCYNLKKITFLATKEGETENALTLSEGAIYSVYNLQEITFPSRLSNLPAKFLTGTTEINDINVVGEGALGSYASANGLLCKKIESGLELVYIPRARTSVTLPNEITQVGEGALGVVTNEKGGNDGTTNTALTYLSIPATVTLIKKDAFRGATHLQELVFQGTRSDSALTIESYAFYAAGSTSSSALTEVTLPGNLVKLGKYAFGGTNNLTYVKVESAHARRTEDDGNQVLDFEEGSFAATNGTYYVTDVYLGKDVPDVKITEVFGNKVQRVSTHAENESFGSNGDGVLYNKAITSIRFYPADRQPDYETPSTLTEIPSNVLYGNESIVNLTIGTSVKTIGDSAFRACINLETVTFLPGGTEGLSIGEYAFGGTGQNMNNTKITSIALPERTSLIKQYAFGYMSKNLVSISIPDTLDMLVDDGHNGATAFAGEYQTIGTVTAGLDLSPNNSWMTINVTRGLENKTKTFTVIDNILYRLDKDGETPTEIVVSPRITNVVRAEAPGSVQHIGNYAFYYNMGLVELTFAERDTMTDEEGNETPLPLTIGASAFYYCTKLEKLELPAGLEEIGENTFNGCSKLLSVKFSEGLKTIGANAFKGCSSLEYVYIPNTVELLESGAFRGCTKLNKVEFQEGNDGTELELQDGEWGHVPEGSTTGGYSFGDGVFSGCTALTSIRLPERTKRIGISAFAASGLEYIYIPSTVTSIGGEAFGISSYPPQGGTASPTNIKQVEFAPNSKLQTIEDRAFYYAEKLTSIDLPDSVTQIYQYAFYKSGLTSIKLPAELKTLGNTVVPPTTSSPIISGSVFYSSKLESVEFNDKLETIYGSTFASTNIKNVTIPASVTTMGTSVFSGLKELQSVAFAEGSKLTALPNNTFDGAKSLTKLDFGKDSVLESIGNSAFSGASSLKTLVLPETLKTLNQSAFANCTSLTSVTFPSTLETIGNSAFSGCSSLDSITWSKDEGGLTNLKAIGTGTAATNVFQKTAFTTFTVPASHNNITLGQNLFNGCKKLTLIKLSESVTALDGAFKGCSSITFIEVDPNNGNFSSKEGVQMLFDKGGASIILVYGELDDTFKFDANATSIGSGAFKGQTALTKVVIPRSVKTIGNEAFMNCINLQEVEFESGSALESIGANAFTYCVNLEKINFENTSYIVTFGAAGSGKGIFVGCNKLEKIDLSKNTKLKTIPTYAFDGLSGLKNVSLPASITSLGGTSGNYTFRNCTSLQEVDLSQMVGLTALGNNVFEGCSSLTTVKLPSKLTSFGSSAFKNCTSLNTINLGDTLITKLEASVFNGCNLSSITIPNTVTQILAAAFANNPNLTTVTFAAGGSANLIITSGATSEANVTDLKNLSPFYGTAIASIAFPSDRSVYLNAGAFAMVDSLKSVSDWGKVENISSWAFMNSGLEGNLVLPNAMFKASTSTSLPSATTGAAVSVFRGTSITGVSFKENSTVEVLGDYFFADCEQLQSIDFANAKSLQTFGLYAFRNCTSLTEVDLTGATAMQYLGATIAYKNSMLSLTAPTLTADAKIGYTFYGCTGLTTVTLPASLTHIANYAFYGCESLATLKGPTKYTLISNYAFYGCGFEELTLVPISTGGTYIFANNLSLTHVSFAEGYDGTALSNYMFDGCENLEEVDFTNAASLTFLGVCTFQHTGLESIDLTPLTKLQYLGGTANTAPTTTTSSSLFYETPSLKSVKLPASLTHIGGWVFYGCEIETIEGLENVVLIGKSAFCGAKFDLAGIALEKLETLGDFAFADNDEMTTADLSMTKITAIPAYAFRGNTSLVNVTLPAGITSIGSYAFSGATALESIVIPEGTTVIGSYAFNNATALASVTLPASVETLEEGAFQSTSSLTQDGINLSNVKRIGAFAFFHGGFTRFTVHAGLEYVGGSAFLGCKIENFDVNGSDFRLENGLLIDGNDTLFAVLDNAVDEDEILTIPAGVKLNAFVFNGVSAKRLVIEEGIDSIPANAFFYAYFDELVLPESLITIEDKAFRNSFIPSITIPRNVTNVTPNAFAEANALEELIFLCDGSLFNGTTKLFQNTTLRRVVLPEGVTKIGDYWFDGAETEEVVLPESVTAIGNYAFRNSGIKRITFPAGLVTFPTSQSYAPFAGSALEEVTIKGTTVPNYVFYKAASLRKVTFKGELTSIGNYAFSGTESLAEIELPETLESLGTYVFQNSGITSITIPDGITSIGNYAFSGAASLTEIVLPAGLTSIGTNAFQNSGITSITLPEGITSISASTFSGAASLTEIVLPAGLTSIGNSAFKDSGIKSITLSADVTLPTTSSYAAFVNSALEEVTFEGTALPKYAFYNATSLRKVNFTGVLESIGTYAFSGCTALTEFEIPATVTSIEANVFQNSGLKSITLHDAIESIGNYAFSGCTALTEIVIPDSVTSLGSYVFMNCTSLRTVKLSNQITKIDTQAFNGCSALEWLVVPESVTAIGATAFNGCGSLKIWFSGTLDSIMSGAFSGLTENATIYFASSAYDVISNLASIEAFYYAGSTSYGPCKANIKFGVTYEQFLAEVNA